MFRLLLFRVSTRCVAKSTAVNLAKLRSQLIEGNRLTCLTQKGRQNRSLRHLPRSELGLCNARIGLHLPSNHLAANLTLPHLPLGHRGERASCATSATAPRYFAPIGVTSI